MDIPISSLFPKKGELIFSRVGASVKLLVKFIIIKNTWFWYEIIISSFVYINLAETLGQIFLGVTQVWAHHPLTYSELLTTELMIEKELNKEI